MMAAQPVRRLLSACERYPEADKQFRPLGENLVGTVRILRGMPWSRPGITPPSGAIAAGRSPGRHPQGAPAAAGISPARALDGNGPSGETGTLTSSTGASPPTPASTSSWPGNSVYLLKDPGRATRLYTGDGRSGEVDVPMLRRPLHLGADPVGGRPAVPARDRPVAEKTWRITRPMVLPLLVVGRHARHGGPVPLRRPIGPGKVCLAGLHKDAWISTVSLRSLCTTR